MSEQQVSTSVVSAHHKLANENCTSKNSMRQGLRQASQPAMAVCLFSRWILDA